MKRIQLCLAVLALLAAGAASAAPYRHYYGPRVVVSANLGWPLYAPYYAPYYYPYSTYPVVTTPVIVQSAPQTITYVQRSDAPVAAAPAAAQGNYWYYCADSKAYYPYVKTCQSAWQPVAAQPAQ